MDALEAAAAISHGWRRVRPGDAVRCLPISDGGDGFGHLLGELLKLKRRRVRTVDAAHRDCTTVFWFDSEPGIAIVESARTVGLAMLPVGEFHPFELDTFGLGAVLRAASSQSGRVLVGIGGSATNDGGFGMARALGWNFYDRRGKPIESWVRLDRLVRVERAFGRHFGCELSVAVDVTNPLLGPRGCSRVYGPQKGLRPRDIRKAEACLERLAAVVAECLGRDFSEVPGSGAAGGLGFGLQAFCGANLQPGFELFARYAGLEEHLRMADVVVTGEGSIDDSTLMGKGVGQLAERCRKRKVPCLGIGGLVSAAVKESGLFVHTCELTELTTRAAAMARPRFWLGRAASELARNLPNGRQDLHYFRDGET